VEKDTFYKYYFFLDNKRVPTIQRHQGSRGVKMRSELVVFSQPPSDIKILITNFIELKKIFMKIIIHSNKMKVLTIPTISGYQKTKEIACIFTALLIPR
jgi:hypothetical protein